MAITDTIKITSLSHMGTTIPGATLTPVVDMNGVPTTKKATVANLANAILSQAGNTYVAAELANLANVAGSAGTVSNAAQPNITSVGTLTTLVVTGNVDIGDSGTGGEYFVSKTGTSVSLGQTAAQTIVVDNTNGIVIGGTAGVRLTGAAGSSVVLGGGSTGQITVSSNLVFTDASVQSTAFTTAKNNVLVNALNWTIVPVTNVSVGTAGEVAYDAGGNLFICTATNTWAKFTGTLVW